MRTVLASDTHCPEINTMVGDFVSCLIFDQPKRFDKFCSIAVIDDSENMLAGLVYHNFDPDNGVVEMSAGAISSRWMTKSVLREIIGMPFDKLGCQCIVARHDETAKHLRRMWTNIGAVEYVIPRVRGRNAPAEVVSVLTDDAWTRSKYVAAR